MKLWRIWQDVNNGYDTFDSAVVAAESEGAARHVHPYSVEAGFCVPAGETPEEMAARHWRQEREAVTKGHTGYYWTVPERVQVELIGEAVPGTKAGVICASFNAG